jgi:hypothetical protein
MITEMFIYRKLSKKAPTFREEMNCERFIRDDDIV